MALSWNEIKDRALRFAKEWAETAKEEADAKPFFDALFDVFGITRKKIGTFEHRVKTLAETDGYIDLLWKGTILVEMKSRGKNLDKAFEQAKAYTYGLKQHELPKYILVSDFETFRLTDLEEDKTREFHLNELVNLDALWKEFENVKDNKNKLSEFQKKLSALRFLDPACGCGNFLVITYRELRLLELEFCGCYTKDTESSM